MKLIPRYESASLARFSHDIVHLFTLLLLQPQLEPPARIALLEAAHKFNRYMMHHTEPLLTIVYDGVSVHKKYVGCEVGNMIFFSSFCMIFLGVTG